MDITAEKSKPIIERVTQQRTLQGEVVKRNYLNSKLGFFHVRDNNNEEIQVRVKTTELCYLINSKAGFSEYSTEAGSNEAVECTWKVNSIKVGSKLIVKGIMEDTERGTTRLVCQRVTVFPHNQISRNIQSAQNYNQSVCKKWAKQEYYNSSTMENSSYDEWQPVELWKTGCLKETCKFRHCWRTEGERKSFYESLKRLHGRIITEFDPNDPFHAKDTISRMQRAQVFAEWIKETICKDMEFVHIIDVAGGNGCLLKELLVRLYPICKSATLIEPNIRKTTEHNLLSKVKKRVHNSEKYPTPVVTFYQSLFDKNFYMDPQKSELFSRENTIILGLHPDQATDEIVDCAFVHKISMAVVPCCVFADIFPHRRIIQNGEEIQVRTYPQLIQYLIEKSSTIESDYMPLTGRNRILFSR